MPNDLLQWAEPCRVMSGQTYDLQAAKERSGWGDRDDIQTWVDLHDVEEGRTPRR